MALRRRRVRTVVRNTTSSATAPSLSIPSDYTGGGVTIWNESAAQCSKSGFTALLARDCDLEYWGFAPAPLFSAGPKDITTGLYVANRSFSDR